MWVPTLCVLTLTTWPALGLLPISQGVASPRWSPAPTSVVPGSCDALRFMSSGRLRREFKFLFSSFGSALLTSVLQ